MSLLNNENRKLVIDFCARAVQCATVDPTSLRFERLRLTDGVLFDISDAAIATQNTLVDKLVKTLGPVRGHRSDVEPAIWGLVAGLILAGKTEPSAAEVDTFLKEVETNSSYSVRLLKPCQNVRLAHTVRSIAIGPVTIRRVASNLRSLRKSCPKIKIKQGIKLALQKLAMCNGNRGAAFRT